VENSITSHLSSGLKWVGLVYYPFTSSFESGDYVLVCKTHDMIYVVLRRTSVSETKHLSKTELQM